MDDDDAPGFMGIFNYTPYISFRFLIKAEFRRIVRKFHDFFSFRRYFEHRQHAATYRRYIAPAQDIDVISPYLRAALFRRRMAAH